MWQVVLGAAIAGSTSFVAKRFFNPFSRLPDDDYSEEDQDPVAPSGNSNGVFRFSSSGSTVNPGSRSGSSSGFKKSSVSKCKVRILGLMEKKKRNGRGYEIERRSENVGDVCSKKQRTFCDASASKLGSCFNTRQDHSSFTSALGVCMMYMMSVERTQISKLHSATDETVKVIQDLKDELSRIKSSLGSEKFSGKPGHVDVDRTEMASRESFDIKSRNGGEYASSVLTEEPGQEAVEMEQLEMELESELQKLNLAETSNVMELDNVVNGSESYQCGGISASELDKKLSHLLIEQQEGQINELEAELQTTQAKLQQKEAELQALKVCVRRLTDLPPLLDRDDEHEEDLNHNQTDKEERKSITGMKRRMESSIHV